MIRNSCRPPDVDFKGFFLVNMGISLKEWARNSGKLDILAMWEDYKHLIKYVKVELALL